MFEIDLVIIIPHNDTFSAYGGKPLFSVILWPLEGQNLVNVAKKQTISEHSPKKYSTKFELDSLNNFSDNDRKRPFSDILWPLEGQHFANVAKK